MRAGREGLRDVARETNASVGDQSHVGTFRAEGSRALVDGGELRHAGAAHDARRADGAGPHADLHDVRARLDDGEGPLGRRDVAADEGELRVKLAQVAQRLEDSLAVPMGRVDDQAIHARGDEHFGPPQPVDGARPDRRRHAERAALVSKGFGMIDGLAKVFRSDEALEPTRGIHERRLLDFVFAEEGLGLFRRRSHRKRLDGGAHDVANRQALARGVTDIAPRAHSDGPALRVDNGKTGDAGVPHEFAQFLERVCRRNRERRSNYGVLELFHPPNLGRLLFGREVLVQNPHASEQRHRDGHATFRHGVHRRRENRRIQREGPETRSHADLGRKDLRIARLKQDVVEG